MSKYLAFKKNILQIWKIYFKYENDIIILLNFLTKNNMQESVVEAPKKSNEICSLAMVRLA